MPIGGHRAVEVSLSRAGQPEREEQLRFARHHLEGGRVRGDGALGLTRGPGGVPDSAEDDRPASPQGRSVVAGDRLQALLEESPDAGHLTTGEMQAGEGEGLHIAIRGVGQRAERRIDRCGGGWLVRPGKPFDPLGESGHLRHGVARRRVQQQRRGRVD